MGSYKQERVYLTIMIVYYDGFPSEKQINKSNTKVDDRGYACLTLTTLKATNILDMFIVI